MKKSIFSWFFLLTYFCVCAESPDFRIKKVVIDAGHGGKDPGCHGASAKEKDVCLSIALNLGKFITENFKEVEVVYTRKTDVFLELHERAKVANDHKADLFICIHANSGPGSVYGAETYVMGLHKTEANLEVAKRENSAILMEDNYQVQYEGFNPNSDESYIALSLLQGTYFEQSLNIAAKIQKYFSALKRTDRGVKQAGFLVLYRTSMPSVLIETGFLTNKEEELFLADSANQAKTAFAIFEAFRDYKNEMERNGITNVPAKKDSSPENPADKVKKTEERKRNTETDNSTNQALVKSNTFNQNDHGDAVIFKVQIASSAKKLPMNSDKFRGLDYLVEYMDGSSYKYVAGNEKSMESATALQKKIKDQGYKDAFVVAFYNEKRITLAEANNIIKLKGTK